MKGANIILFYLILVCLFACNEKSKTKNYYNIHDYVVKDSIFNKKHILTQVDWVNKYDSTREMVRIYWENGLMASQVFFHNTKKDGPFIAYYPDESKIMGKGWNRDNSFDGEVTIYYENGNIDKLMYFKDGKKVGVWKTFDSTGHIIDSTAY